MMGNRSALPRNCGASSESRLFKLPSSGNFDHNFAANVTALAFGNRFLDAIQRDNLSDCNLDASFVNQPRDLIELLPICFPAHPSRTHTLRFSFLFGRSSRDGDDNATGLDRIETSVQRL